MTGTVATRILIISDTHGERLQHPSAERVDVAIHCGDLTEESRLDEFMTSLRLLKSLNAPLKLVIAGNRDFTLDTPKFKKKLGSISPPLEDALVIREYGDFGEAQALLDSEEAKAAGIVFLDEGTHRFQLANGGTLTIYASPYTASLSCDWGFQYHPDEEHEWNIDGDVDVVVTHSPPKGVLDYTDDRVRAGSPSLFAAVARARPALHCFGHIHEAWGAKLITWRDQISENPSHFTDIDNERSVVIETLAGITVKKYDDPNMAAAKMEKRSAYLRQGCCAATLSAPKDNQTLFINASIEGPARGTPQSEDTQQLPWIVNIDLPASKD